MREFFDEYAGMMFVMLMGFGFVEGFALLFKAVLSGWTV